MALLQLLLPISLLLVVAINAAPAEDSLVDDSEVDERIQRVERSVGEVKCDPATGCTTGPKRKAARRRQTKKGIKSASGGVDGGGTGGKQALKSGVGTDGSGIQALGGGGVEGQGTGGRKPAAQSLKGVDTRGETKEGKNQAKPKIKSRGFILGE